MTCNSYVFLQEIQANKNKKESYIMLNHLCVYYIYVRQRNILRGFFWSLLRILENLGRAKRGPLKKTT